MDLTIEAIKETPIWQLYEKGRNYHRQIGIYTDTDRGQPMIRVGSMTVGGR